MGLPHQQANARVPSVCDPNLGCGVIGDVIAGLKPPSKFRSLMNIHPIFRQAKVKERKLVPRSLTGLERLRTEFKNKSLTLRNLLERQQEEVGRDDHKDRFPCAASNRGPPIAAISPRHAPLLARFADRLAALGTHLPVSERMQRVAALEAIVMEVSVRHRSVPYLPGDGFSASDTDALLYVHTEPIGLRARKAAARASPTLQCPPGPTRRSVP